MSALNDRLQSYPAAAVIEREDGKDVDRLACAFLTSDPVQAEEYSSVHNGLRSWSKV